MATNTNILQSFKIPVLKFELLKIVSNPNSIHGVYPYRGKISALDAKQLIDQLPAKGTLLDPFCGSGTIIYEAKKRGLNVIGVDNNPIAVQIAKGKLSQFDLNESFKKISLIINSIDLSKKLAMPEKAAKYFHEDTANQIMHLKEYYDHFDDYEKSVFLGTVCLVARACNKFKWSSTQIGSIASEKENIDFFSKFLTKLKKHAYPIDTTNSQVVLGDSRQLSEFIDRKADFVYTSPPYFDALDYTSNYTRIVYDLFEEDVSLIKKKLIQSFDGYIGDMKKSFEEIKKVTTDNAMIIFVVGDKKKGNKIISGGDFFKEIIKEKPLYTIEREYTDSPSKIWDKINKTHRKEQIIVWDKSQW